MQLHGKNIIGARLEGGGDKTFRGFDPRRGEELEPPFYEATADMVDQAAELAARAFHSYRGKSAEEIAHFLEEIARRITALGEELIVRAAAETALSSDRLVGERARTTTQLQLFASVVREGSWVEASIDRAQPERTPQPKPDLRRLLIPIGPVGVFGASNFPFAFSVAGGDTASALAAGNPVIVKAHPAHPGTSELVAGAIGRAAEATGMPDGVFSMLHGRDHNTSLRLVCHPAIKAVGFTGSLKAGRALFDAAARRPEPIPVYAEMGSVNPVFVLPGALRERGAAIAEGLKQSVTLGTGQFCTSPGIVVGIAGDGIDQLTEKVTELITQTPPATMLYPGILRNYEEGVGKFRAIPGVQIRESRSAPDAGRTEAGAVVFATDAETFLTNDRLGEEVFGPATLIVRCPERAQLEQVARHLQGHLTATIHGTADDLREFRWLISILELKVGRLIFNGFPTGVEVCASMQHGGPYPATTDVRSTSVGTAAIKRFARPLSYQNFPQEALPIELQDVNRRGIWRLIDNNLTKDDC